MATPPIDDDVLIETARIYANTQGNIMQGARAAGIARSTFDNRVDRARERGYIRDDDDPGFEAEEIPDEIAPVEELIERRKKEFARKSARAEATRLINVTVKMDGPVGIAHFGDVHIDDSGTDIGRLETHVRVVQETDALFAANVGDLQNNWIGRLARLYSEQSTSAAEAWALTEWLVTSVDWLYLLMGNHDLWTGASGDKAIERMRAGMSGVTEAWGARLNLTFPNGKQVRINARHDFSGSSIWNPNHGPMRAVQLGFRDHVLTCGHRHISAHSVLKCPATGLVSHMMRVAGYKIHDRYARDKGLPNMNISPAFVTIIDPQYADDDPRLITTLYDVEEAAEYLTWKRARK